ncbi:MAG: Tim44 domain-containing protein [Proteobacteria bacterium]|nr:Tim44 domain-containing protein [Pseudomonadota bacterium]
MAWGTTSSGAALALFGGAAYYWRAKRRAAPLPVCAVAVPATLPAGFDRRQVLDAARRHFVQVQQAWDAGDVGALRALTLPDLLDELCGQLPPQGVEPGGTAVLSLHAELLGFDDLGPAYLASVEFSGMMREASHSGPVPFRELWMLAQVKDDPPAWRLARHQALL